ncbi:hypothetical protein NP233_g1523 [Leucocoprinus birnbaumii]|uniref:Hydrophobin n=1 Tax=Leucocoprinus birnbaumii TaxID=56174 RepID=A0AAD5YXW7_9AGAR|nr:hypothetical protein NP233_g1523 [Leucocoprinus birnbaumii]
MITLRLFLTENNSQLFDGAVVNSKLMFGTVTSAPPRCCCIEISTALPTRCEHTQESPRCSEQGKQKQSKALVVYKGLATLAEILQSNKLFYCSALLIYFNMQFKLSALVAAALTTSAIAAPNGGSGSSCSTGPIQCCNSVQSAGSSAASVLLAAVGAVVQDVNVPIGITCSPINVIGVGGNSCSAQTVCCENNSFHGVVAIGCTPININA